MLALTTKVFVLCFLTNSALAMAEAQEKKPSTPSKFRTKVDLDSASGWDKWNLKVFNAYFDPSEFSDLTSELDKLYKLPELQGMEALGIPL